jgi:ribosome modulation factor
MRDRPDAFREGIDAYAMGAPRDHCHYDAGSKEQELWLAGWDEAKAIHEQVSKDIDANRT